MMLKIFNVLAFQLTWLAATVGAANNATWPSVAALAAFVIVHRLLAPDYRHDFILAGLAALAGLLIDSAIINTGVITYSAPFPFAGLAPLWIVLLWANLALAVNHSLAWLHDRYWLAAICGALAGPGSYLAGTALGAAVLQTDTVIVALVFGATWACVLPAMFGAARALQRRSRAAAA